MKETPTSYARAYLALAQATKKSELAELTSRFWKAVWRHKHFNWRRQIIKKVEELWGEQHNLQQVEVMSAREYSPANLNQLKQELTVALHSEVDLKVQIKPHLLSGLVITVGDKRYDGSLKGRLDALYDKLAGATSTKDN